MHFLFSFLVFFAMVGPSTGGSLTLRPKTEVASGGVYLDDLITGNDLVPHLLLAPSPAFGSATVFTKVQVSEFLSQNGFGLEVAGPAQTRVTRKARLLGETELLELLNQTMQRDVVKERGQLELQLAGSLSPISVPDETLKIRILELPATGINPSMIVRYELTCNDQRIGNWQASLRAHIWREVPVAQSPLKRGQFIRDADIILEKRDVVAQRDVISAQILTDPNLELAENVNAGMPLLTRSIKTHPVVQRGHLLDAVIQDGSLSIALKVEAMEDGVAGQIIRVRNPKSRRELSGKIQNEQTILISM